MTDQEYTYEIKCRKCSKITKMWFGNNLTKPEDFNAWFSEHSTFPIQKQCDCDNGSIMLHDLVSKNLIF